MIEIILINQTFLLISRKVFSVLDLTILKMMASKNYILSCYEVMVESKIAKNRALAKLGVQIDDCYCATKNDNSWSGKPG